MYSKKGSQVNAFLMDAGEIQKIISSPSKSIDYEPKEIDASSVDFEKGTRIVLKEIKKRRTVIQDISLKKRLARRFSIIGTKNKFKVWLNGVEITVEDRDYFHKIEYLWYYGDESAEFDALATKKSNSESGPTSSTAGIAYLAGWV
ncbi:MAG: hypothetical protein IPM82_08040 [Saprospiraceae bacterium]|nr:hypothetical protein [Saprospiraceae bacterium]